MILCVPPAAALAASVSTSVIIDRPMASVLLMGPVGQLAVPVFLHCPRFVLDRQTVGGGIPVSVRGRLESGRPVRATFAPVPLDPSGALEVELYAQWSARERVLRKWVRYRVEGRSAPELVREIVLDTVAPSLHPRQAQRVPPQSYPILFDGGFAGIEFPVATTRVENGEGSVAHSPGVRVASGEWHTSRTAVFGVAEKGRERAAFESYVSKHYTHRKRLHIDYNSWWSTGIPYTETVMLELMRTLSEKLHKPYGVGIDTFCVDLGWSNPRSIWEIDPVRFPAGLGRVAEGARSMGGNLGLWNSPIAAYPSALDTEWAASQGYKTFPNKAYEGAPPLMCSTDKRYLDALRRQLAMITEKYRLRMIKFDQYRLECPQADHGHEPGPLSAERMAEAMISVCDAVRIAAPGIFIESNAFGSYQSPWWLWHVDVLLSDLGGDATYGLVPCPIYRESYTSGRDYHNLLGDALNVVPPSDLHVCGFVHQSPDPFLNDGVMTVMRGSRFVPLYVNPQYMTDARWASLAALLKWTRANAALLERTCPMPPAETPGPTRMAPMARSPYGYAHWRGMNGLIAVRNPWIAPTTYRLRLDERCGLERREAVVSAVSEYPCRRNYGMGLRYGDTVDIPLAPYETVVVRLRPGARAPRGAPPSTRRWIESHVVSSTAERVRFASHTDAMSPYAIDRSAGAQEGLRAHLTADIEITAPQAELLILVEEPRIPADPVVKATVDDKPAQLTWSGSDTGWAASHARARLTSEQWLFARARLAPGRRRVAVDVLTRSADARMSAWVWAYREGRGFVSGLPLPEPEIVSLDARCLLEAVSPSVLPAAVGSPANLVETIDGAYLDAMRDVTEVAGALERNRGVLGGPMIICGRRYGRGLGTVAPSRLRVPVGGQYRRLQGWVGIDAGHELWDDSVVTFEIYGRGKKLWSSGPMVRNEPAKRIDLDVIGTGTIELVTLDSGTEKTSARASNLADWAEICLLR